MSGIEIGALCVVGAFLLFAAVRLFRGPVKLALRVLVNSALGFGAVWLLNLTAAVTGIRLGLIHELRLMQCYLMPDETALRELSVVVIEKLKLLTDAEFAELEFPLD